MSSLVLWSCVFGILIAGIGAEPQKDLRNVKYNKRGGLGQDPLVSVKRQASCSPDQFACRFTCVPADYQCDTQMDCTTGEDEQDCPTDCTGPNQFRCSNGDCIPAAYHCDHRKDCANGSDETNCGYTCGPQYFQCRNGLCVVSTFICDGDNDCGDYSDELNCASIPCDIYHFRCPNNICIPNFYQCNGHNDCHDNADEVGCTCDSNHFQCQTGDCISYSYRCDGHDDCGDRSDEENCPEIHPGACADRLTFEDCVRMNASTYPICDYYADAHSYCRKFCGLCGK